MITRSLAKRTREVPRSNCGTIPLLPPDRSNNSKNESSKAIARHQKVRSMFQGNSVAGKGLSPGGTASNNLDTGAGVSSYRTSTRVVPFFLSLSSSYRLQPTTSSHFSSFFAPTFPTSSRTAPQPVVLRCSLPLEFQQQRRIDNGSSRLSSLFYTHHLTPGRREERRGRGGTANASVPLSVSLFLSLEEENETWNSIDRKSLPLLARCMTRRNRGK